ncbi:DUF115 domain-containing protein [Paenibacillus alkaliterrae]|uniref:motility associated factor glycosyltransferase family protein n=1 Tax=Paenibacillus alkaliterrae TaxID=320909 RepID=UPI001F322090|nr:6-hydroxymethylpterin diphosphokinase MptE-like protein [Paenibacillus alkaliterrae]MCF2941393.1 DUF115 domain-containing protein [Paenibacillus alkaliterrae]
MDTRTVPTVEILSYNKKIIFHSKYDPIKEAQDWVRNALKLADSGKPLIIIGLAAGYHIEALSRVANDAIITVLEFNSQYYNWFKNSPFYNRIEKLPNIELYDIAALTDNKRESIFANLRSNNILIYKQALDIFPEEYTEAKEYLSSIQIQKKSFLNQSESMERNFDKNITLDDPGIKDWKNYYENKPMLLISAGPSLDKQLPLLKEIKDDGKVILGSVGTAVKPLIRHGITPDFVMITDPNEGTLPQLQKVDLTSTPLFYLSTAYNETIVLHGGARYVVLQDGYDKAEYMAALRKEPLIKTGGSVSTTLLDLMIYLGASTVGLVGQDLAFTNGLSHASGTPFQRLTQQEPGLVEVLDYYQVKQIASSKNLVIYKKWLERYAEHAAHLNLYNCTEGGAFIKNWQHLSLKEFYSTVQ